MKNLKDRLRDMENKMSTSNFCLIGALKKENLYNEAEAIFGING